MQAKNPVRATVGNSVLQHVSPVDPRVAEGLSRQPREPSATTQQEMQELLEEETRRNLTDPYQCLLMDVKKMHRKGNFKATQGEAIVQRIRDLSLPETRTLNLSKMTLFDNFTELLAPYLSSKICRLTAVDLSGTQIGVQGTIAIAQAINTTLQSLQLSASAIPVAVATAEAKMTRSISLSDQQYNHLDAAVIGVLCERNRKIERLDVSKNRLTGSRTNNFHGLSILMKALLRCTQLKHINFHSVQLRSEGLVDLANVIAKMPVLESLVISSNNLTLSGFGNQSMTGMEALCSCLWEPKKLVQLNLADNALDYRSAEHIAQMLSVNRVLTALDLSSNPLSDAGAVQLALGVKKNAVLRTLIVHSCEFGSEGFETLAEQLGKFNRTLQTIDLQNHQHVRSHGYQALVHCVSINPTLLHIALSASPKYDKFIRKLERLLAVNVMLTKLRSDFASFSFDTLSESQRTNFVHKLQELSETEVLALSSMHVLQAVRIAETNALRALRFYAQQEQYAPLKRLFWVFEASDRQQSAAQRSSKQQHRREDEDDDDVWDYPLS